jgi:hypothetical protein
MFLLEFANSAYCARQGKPLTWHLHCTYPTMQAAEEGASIFERVGILVRIYRLTEVDRSAGRVVRFRRLPSRPAPEPAA